MLVKDLLITVTYKVRYCDIDLPEEIVDQLKDEINTELMTHDEYLKHWQAVDWMIDNCRERDADSTEFEVNFIDYE